MAAVALLISAGITAQEQEQTATQTQTRKQEQSRSQAGTRAQGLPANQVEVPDQYRNRGQMVSERRHARNEERKALKRQQKEQKKREKALPGEKSMDQEGAMEREREMKQEKAAPQNRGARPAAPKGNAVKASRGSGPGKR